MNRILRPDEVPDQTPEERPPTKEQLRGARDMVSRSFQDGPSHYDRHFVVDIDGWRILLLKQIREELHSAGWFTKIQPSDQCGPALIIRRQKFD